jgi:hypothetical protein
MRSVDSIERRRPRPAAGRHISTILGIAFLMAATLLSGGCRSNNPSQAESAPAPAQSQVEPPAAPPVEAAKKPEPRPDEPISLFDGETLGQWKSTDFGGQGEVSVKDGAIHMAMGSYMTGITWTGPVLRMNYEITLEAMRVEGHDFFCGLTFPVGEKPCTLVLGGWGGSVCGLSSIDYYDASENPTTRIVSFETGKWYFVRLRVEPNRIRAWLDGEDLVDLDTTDRKIDIRPEVDLSQPLGIATWTTAGAVRNIHLKKLPEQTQ